MPILENEKELENYLMAIDMKDYSVEHPIGVWGKAFQQVELKGYGIADLIYVAFSPQSPCNKKPEIQIHIVELKKGKIDLNAVGQISRYKVAIKRIIEKAAPKFDCEIYGVLVGHDYVEGDVRFAVDSIDWLDCYFYKIDLISGITFKKTEGWYRTSETLDVPFINQIWPIFKAAYRESFRHCRDYKKMRSANVQRVDKSMAQGTGF